MAQAALFTYHLVNHNKMYNYGQQKNYQRIP